MTRALGLTSEDQGGALAAGEPRRPLFVDALGRVTCAPLLPHAKVPDVLPPPNQVVWMTWAECLAAVWGMRLRVWNHLRM